MKSKIFIIILLALLILIVHLIAVFAGLYGVIPIDIPQHIIAGMIFGLIYFWWLSTYKKEILSKPLIFISIVSFAVFGSVIWEILEFSVWKLFPVFANNFKFFSPTVLDLLVDVISGLIGGVIIGIYATKK